MGYIVAAAAIAAAGTKLSGVRSKTPEEKIGDGLREIIQDEVQKAQKTHVGSPYHVRSSRRKSEDRNYGMGIAMGDFLGSGMPGGYDGDMTTPL